MKNGPQTSVMELSYIYGWIHLSLTDRESMKCVIKKNYIVFHFDSMKIGEVVVISVYKNFTKFHWIWMKNKKVFIMTHLMDGLSIKGRWIWPYSDLNKERAMRLLTLSHWGLLVPPLMIEVYGRKETHYEPKLHTCKTLGHRNHNAYVV